MLNYISISIIPLLVLFVFLIAVKEKKDIYSLFIIGVKDGLKMVYSVFPYVFAVMVAIGILNDSGLIEKILEPFEKLFTKLGIPKDILEVILLRPLSGSASNTVAMEIFEKNGPDSKSGNIVSLLMGSTETTLYSMALLYSSVKVKKTRGTLIAGFTADFIAIALSIFIVNKFF